MIFGKISSKVIISIIILGLIVPAGVLNPEPAKAGLPSCLVEGFLKNAISSLAGGAILKGITYLENTVISVVKKIPGVGAIAGAILGGGEDAVKDSGVRRTLNSKIYKDIVARCLARMVFDSAVGGMLDVVRKQGRDGGAAYVTNWRNFQANSQYRGEAVFRGILANTPLCDYLREDINGGFRITPLSKISLKGLNIRIGSSDPFTLRGRCTLPEGFSMSEYQNDFAGNGGWAAYDRLLEPQNNAFGFSLMAQDELEQQRAAAVAADAAEAQAGRGYLGLAGCLQKDSRGQCIIYASIKTPGSYLADSVAATIQQELGWITNVHYLQELVIDGIASRLTSRLLNLGSGESDPQYATDQDPPDICPDFGPNAVDPACRPLDIPTPTPGTTPLHGGESCNTNVSPNSFRYTGAVHDAQDNVAANHPELFKQDCKDALGATVTCADPVGTSNYLLKDNIRGLKPYDDAVIAALTQAGYHVNYDGEEVQINMAGDGFSEQVKINKTCNASRDQCAWYSSGQAVCSPAATF